MEKILAVVAQKFGAGVTEDQTLLQQQRGLKRQILHQAHCHLSRVQIREAQSQTPVLSEIVLKMMQVAGDPKTITAIYKEFKLDAMPLIQALTQLVQRQATKFPYAIGLLGDFFAEVTLIQPQVKEIGDALFKVIKGSQEMKAAGYECLAKVLKSGHACQHLEAWLKTLLKNPEKEHVQAWYECVVAAVSNYPAQPIQWPQVWPELQIAAIRQMEIDGTTYSLLYEMVRTRLVEAKSSGNPLQSYTEFNINLNKDQKKKILTIEAPRCMSDVLRTFVQAMEKLHQKAELTQAQQNVCLGYSNCFAELTKHFAANLEATQPEAFVKAVASLQSKKALSRMIEAVCDAYKFTDYEGKLILQLYNQCLKRASSTFPEVYLDALTRICERQEQGTIAELFERAQVTSSQFVDTMQQLIQQPQACDAACCLVEAMARTSPTWLHSFISLFISSVQIQSADIGSFLSGQQFVYTGPQHLHLAVSQLNRQSETLALLFAVCPKQIGGEPLALSNAAFQTASNFIAGKQVGKLISAGINAVTLEEVGRREHGWVIVEGLIRLGPAWVHQHLPELQALLDAQFSKTMCQIDTERLAKDPKYREIFVQEYKTKARALKAVLTLLQTPKLPKKTVQYLGKTCAGCLEFMMYPSDLIEPSESHLVKSDLFECFEQIPCHFYQSKVVKLLHNLCEHLVQSNHELPPGFLDPEDDCLSPKPQQQKSLIRSTMQLFVKIFRCGIVTSTNKEQLINHFVLHTNQSVKKVKQPNGEVLSQPTQYRPDKLKKMARLGATLVQACRQSEKDIKQFSAQLTNIRHNLLKPAKDDLLPRIAAELQIELEAETILQNGPWFMFNLVDQALDKSDVQKLKESAALCAMYVRHFQPQPESYDRLQKVYQRLLRVGQAHRYATHYATVIAQENLDFLPNLMPALFQAHYQASAEMGDLANLTALCNKFTDQYSQIICQDHPISEPKTKDFSKALNPTLIETISQIQQNTWLESAAEQLEGWKRVYSELTSQMSLQELLSFLKTECFQYVHLSPMQQQDQNRQNNFQAPLSPTILAFLIDTLMQQISTAKADNDYKPIVSVMQFALATFTSTQPELKLAACRLLQKTISLLRHAVDVVGDEDDELSPRSQLRQNYLNNPLVVESFEAQVFSAIRSGLNSCLRVQQECYGLIKQFVLLPITQDSGLVRKILQMLMPQHTYIYDSKVMGRENEGLVAETHFCKLRLLAEMFTAASQTTVNLEPQEGDLPSKFTAELRSDLKENFAQHIEVMAQHFRTALVDCLETTKTKIFLQGGTIDHSKVQASLPAICDALRVMSHAWEIVSQSVLQGLRQAYQPSMCLFDWYTQKETYLRLALASSDQMSQNQDTQSELINILAHLTRLGVAELTTLVLQLHAKLLPRVLQSVDQIVYLTLGILLQANPDLNSSPQLNASHQPILAQVCLETLTIAAEKVFKQGTATQVCNFMQQVYCRLCAHILKTPTEQQVYAKAVLQMTHSMQSMSVVADEVSEHLVQACHALLSSADQVHQTIGVAILNSVAGLPVYSLLSSLSLQQLQQILAKLKTPADNLFALTLQKAYSDQPIHNTLQYLNKAFTQLSNDQKPALMPLYLALLFGVIQTPESAVRHEAANCVRLLFTEAGNRDCVRELVQARDASGGPMISELEQATVRRIVQSYQAQQQPK